MTAEWCISCNTWASKEEILFSFPSPVYSQLCSWILGNERVERLLRCIEWPQLRYSVHVVRIFPQSGARRILDAEARSRKPSGRERAKWLDNKRGFSWSASRIQPVGLMMVCSEKTLCKRCLRNLLPFFQEQKTDKRGRCFRFRYMRSF